MANKLVVLFAGQKYKKSPKRDYYVQRLTGISFDTLHKSNSEAQVYRLATSSLVGVVTDFLSTYWAITGK